MVVVVKDKVLTFKAMKPEKNREKLDPKPVTERTGDMDIRDFIRGKWDELEENEESPDGNMNLCDHFVLAENHINGMLISNEKIPERSFRKCLSSPMLFYRCCCTFPDNTRVQYKDEQIWTCVLKHQETGNIMILSDVKGVPYCTVDEKFSSIQDLPKAFSEDAIEVLNFILSDQCVHPYDDTVAGTQA